MICNESLSPEAVSWHFCPLHKVGRVSYLKLGKYCGLCQGGLLIDEELFRYITLHTSSCLCSFFPQ